MRAKPLVERAAPAGEHALVGDEVVDRRVVVRQSGGGVSQNRLSSCDGPGRLARSSPTTEEVLIRTSEQHPVRMVDGEHLRERAARRHAHDVRATDGIRVEHAGGVRHQVRARVARPAAAYVTDLPVSRWS